jgi:O-antigen/teichoic acid export membrane protein
MALLKRRLLFGGVWALTGKVVTMLSAFLANVLLARVLSPHDLGAYLLAFSIVWVGGIFGLGVGQATVRFIAENVELRQLGRARRMLAITLGIGSLGAAGLGVVYLWLGGFAASEIFHAPALAAANGLVAGWILVMALQMLLAEGFRGFHDIRLATIFGGLGSGVLLTISLAFLLLVRDQVNLSTVLLSGVGSTTVSVMLAVWLLNRKIALLPSLQGVASYTQIGSVTRVALPILVTNLAFFALSSADLWILGAFQPQQEVAIYGTAARMVLLVAAPILVINSVVPSTIAEMYAQQRIQELQRVLRITAALASVPAFLLIVIFLLVGGPILGLAFGDYYSKGVMILILLSIGMLVNVWVGACGMVLLMTGHQALAMAIAVASTIVMIVIGLIVVDPYGATGVAVASAVGVGLCNASLWLATKWKTAMWTHADFSALATSLRNLKW